MVSGIPAWTHHLGSILGTAQTTHPPSSAAIGSSLSQGLPSWRRRHNGAWDFALSGAAQRSLDLEIARRLLAAICDNLIFDLLPFIERAETRAFDRRNMDEDVPAAFFRLNKSEALLVLNHFFPAS